MKLKRPLARWKFIALLLILALALTACGEYRRGVSWATLDLVTIDGQPLVLVTYNDRVDLIDPYQGGQSYSLSQTNADGQVQPWQILGSNYESNTFFVNPMPSENTNGATLIFPTYNNRLLEFYLENGQAVNTAGIALPTRVADGSAQVLAPIVENDGLLYVGYHQHDLVALDSETYQEVWRLETNEGVWAAPIVNDGVLYVSSMNHYFYALDAVTGDELWSLDLEGSLPSTALLYNNFLYVGGFSHNLYKISLDGEIVATYAGNNWLWSTPVVYEDVLFYTDLGGYVYALNPDTLSEVWVQRPAERGIRPAPLVTENFVIVASRDGQVYWLTRQTGVTVQSAEFKDRVEILSDILYLPADEENNHPALMLVASADTGKLVTAFNLETFTPQWVYNR